MLVINATAYPEGRFVSSLCVRMEGGRVQEVSSALAPLPGEEVLDLAGDYLLPGFVDVHIHGYKGRDTMQGEAAIRAMSRELYKEGVAAFLPTTMSAAPEETMHAISGVRAVMASPEPVGAQVLGVHMEAPFLNPLRAGAQRKEHFCAPAMETLLVLTGDNLQGIRLLTLAPELEGSEGLIRAARGAGLTVSLGHTCATAEETHLAADRGATHVTHTFNAQTPLNHREPGVPGAALTDERLYCEVIADGIHLHGDVVRLLVRAKGADKAVAVTDAMEAAGMPEGSYRLGGSRVLVKGREARLEDGTLAGSVLTMRQALENLLHRFGIPPEDAVRMCTLTPARSIGEELAGRICPGAPAPLTRWTKDWRMVGIVDQASPACNRAANRL